MLLSLFSLTPPALAATITVDSAGDTITVDGDCTLHEAIANAESEDGVDQTGGDCTTGSIGSDIIIFDAGLAGLTITLTTAVSTSGFLDKWRLCPTA